MGLELVESIILGFIRLLLDNHVGEVCTVDDVGGPVLTCFSTSRETAEIEALQGEEAGQLPAHITL